jgi:hypothetical protein
MWLKPLFARTLTYVKSGFKKWLEDLPHATHCAFVAVNYNFGESQPYKHSMPTFRASEAARLKFT